MTDPSGASDAERSTPHLVHRVIARLNVGGPAMHVVNLATGLDPAEWRTVLVAGSVEADEGDMEYYAHDRGVTVVHLPAMARSLHPVGDLVSLWGLYRLFRRDRPHVVHTHTAKAGTLGRIAAILAGVPIRIHTFHGHVLGGTYFTPVLNRLFLGIERQLARGTHRLVVLTRRQAREMAGELEIAPADRFTVIPLGLDMDRFRAVDADKDGPAVRELLGFAPDDVVIAIVGRLVPVKNHELFLDAVARLPAVDGRPVRGVVVGGGEREEELRRRADAMGLSDRVRWLGWRRDLETLYPAFDIVALTSDDEGTPVALLEALASGVRVVARDVGGVGEVLDDAGSGVLVPEAARPEEWATALKAAMATAPPDAEVRDAVVRRYSVERLAADVDALYRAELERA